MSEEAENTAFVNKILIVTTCLMAIIILSALVALFLHFRLSYKLHRTSKCIELKVRRAGEQLKLFEFPNQLLEAIAEKVGFSLADAKRDRDILKSTTNSVMQTRESGSMGIGEGDGKYE